MLIQLKIKNFYSIENELILDMRVPSKTPEDERFSVVEEEGDLRLRKVFCLIGANASGKTTILRAIGFLRMFVSNSFEVCRAGDGVPLSAFDDNTDPDSESFIEIEFYVPPDHRQQWARYRYTLVVSTRAPESFVKQEKLEAGGVGGKFVRIFDRVREGDGYSLKHHSSFDLKRDDPRAKARSNVSLISNLLQFEHGPSEEFSTIFQTSFLSNVQINKQNIAEEAATKYLKGNEDAIDDFVNVIRKIDIGISNFDIQEVEGEDWPSFSHDGLSQTKHLFFESQGTKNFYCLFPFIHFAKEYGSCAAIDELDSDLHPSLVYEIIRWFQDSRESTPYSQLITTLNHPSVLVHLEKEEVGVVEKDFEGRTSFVPLENFEGVRRDTNLYKKYMGGHFGGLPTFG